MYLSITELLPYPTLRYTRSEKSLLRRNHRAARKTYKNSFIIYVTLIVL